MVSLGQRVTNMIYQNCYEIRFVVEDRLVFMFDEHRFRDSLCDKEYRDEYRYKGPFGPDCLIKWSE